MKVAPTKTIIFAIGQNILIDMAGNSGTLEKGKNEERQGHPRRRDLRGDGIERRPDRRAN
jgi:hypothetical protein